MNQLCHPSIHTYVAWISRKRHVQYIYWAREVNGWRDITSYLLLLHRGFWGPSLKSKEYRNAMLLLSLPFVGLVGQPGLMFLGQWALGPLSLGMFPATLPECSRVCLARSTEAGAGSVGQKGRRFGPVAPGDKLFIPPQHREPQQHWWLEWVLCGLAWLGAQLHQQAEAEEMGTKRWTGRWRPREEQHTVSGTSASMHRCQRPPGTHNDQKHAAATCVFQKTVLLNGKRNSRCSLGLVWTSRR